MSIVSTVQWLTSTSLSQLIQSTHGAIAGIQIVHLVSLSALFASALVLALRVTGRGLVDESTALMAGRFVPAIWICVALLFVSGVLLIVAEPFRTITNKIFYPKMILLVAAIALTTCLSSIARRSPEHPAPARVRVIAISSMLVWVAIMFAGRFIAYT